MALDRQSVVRTALRVLDEVGLDGLTLRRIAAELDVRAPALYWHFKNKQELLDAMATTLLVDALDKFGVPDTANWVELAEAYGHGLRTMLLSHRDGARMFSGTFLADDTAFGSMERAIRTLTDAGFSVRDAMRGLNTIYCFAIGFTIEEQAVYPRPRQRAEQYDLAARAERLDPDRLPLVRATGEEVLGSFDERFEHGLALIISGLTTTLGRADP